jgi:hypothetical protein
MFLFSFSVHPLFFEMPFVFHVSPPPPHTPTSSCLFKKMLLTFNGMAHNPNPLNVSPTFIDAKTLYLFVLREEILKSMRLEF